jgi:hypothetical protein
MMPAIYQKVASHWLRLEPVRHENDKKMKEIYPIEIFRNDNFKGKQINSNTNKIKCNYIYYAVQRKAIIIHRG